MRCRMRCVSLRLRVVICEAAELKLCPRVQVHNHHLASKQRSDSACRVGTLMDGYTTIVREIAVYTGVQNSVEVSV